MKRRPTRQQLATLAGYGAAAAIYIAIGVAYTDFLLSVIVATAYLLIVMLVVPLAVRRLL